ncbi:hypothetical protein [Bacteroides sp. Marseille-P3684]|uniref:hypothetical protein n=1 Tax=Bacteroides sp. Marseille-P3684 TaxID=2086579 RepID=UPI000D0B8140|nr:hypothetical protein [Bacteroides sp. Marseille-P3684]
MGRWEQQQAERNEAKERDKTRRDNLAKYLYDLSKLAFAGLVIGSFATVFTKDNVNISLLLYSVLVGSVVTLLFAWLGNRILK